MIILGIGGILCDAAAAILHDGRLAAAIEESKLSRQGLKPGAHTITLTATDSDGNAITATTEITVRMFEPMTGTLLSCGNAETMAALPAATWTATVTV